MSETELYLRCLEFVRDQSAGEWGEVVEREDARKLVAFVRDLMEKADPQ